MPLLGALMRGASVGQPVSAVDRHPDGARVKQAPKLCEL